MDITKKLYKYNAFDGSQELIVRCSYSFYNINGTLAVCMYRKPGHTFWASNIYILCSEPLAKITINHPLSVHLDYNEQFVNEIEMPEIGAWLIVNDIAKPTGKYIITEDGILEAFRFKLPKSVHIEIENMRRRLNTQPPSPKETKIQIKET